MDSIKYFSTVKRKSQGMDQKNRNIQNGSKNIENLKHYA